MIIHTLISVIILGSVLCQNPGPDVFQNTLSHIKPRTSPEAQTEAARAVARRLLGDERSPFFILTVDPNLGPIGKDTFSIGKNEKGQIEIVGTSGVAATWGLHYYLKTYCNAHISWEGNQIELPRVLPEVKVKVTSNDRFRYYMNVCTMGYTFAWWQWDHWEKHIDWMALNGINLALAFNGQEAIWQRVYLQLNFTLDEINEHFGGPAFLPWSRMGNMRGFGGPLTENWHNQSVQLQHQILNRMRELGIIPVLPAFAGHVPRAFPRLFPQANVTKVGVWNHFSDKYCCPYLLEPTDPLFQKIGEQFLKTYIEEFGTDHIYNCDTFNENEPHTGELRFLKNVGRSIFEAMNHVDPEAIWLMQGWLFVHNDAFWTQPRVQSFLTSVPLGRMIVLDLQSEQFPQYKKLNSYYGQPFIWCMLQNFGGTLGMFGSAQIVNRQVFAARNMKNSTMVGTGLTPEGINQNYVVYELMNEMAYRKEPVDLNKWFENYAQRRYGAWNEYAVAAWKNFGKTVYGFSGSRKVRGKYVVSSRPTLNHSTWTWYDRDMFYKAWYVFLQARHGRRNNTLYRHDVVDVTRQAVQLKIDELYIDLMKSVDRKNATSVTDIAAKILSLLGSLDELLASSKDFLLGSWLEMAKDLATNEAERELYEYNARNQITLWGPRGEIRDYANKQWAGIVADYFLPRWNIFLSQLTDAVTKGTRMNVTRVNELMFASEKQFTLGKKNYPTQETGDSIEIAVEILTRWYQPSSTLIDVMKTLVKGLRGRV